MLKGLNIYSCIIYRARRCHTYPPFYSFFIKTPSFFSLVLNFCSLFLFEKYFDMAHLMYINEAKQHYIFEWRSKRDIKLFHQYVLHLSININTYFCSLDEKITFSSVFFFLTHGQFYELDEFIKISLVAQWRTVQVQCLSRLQWRLP